jgi:tripartite-type tricarboxylate transporter receptor subunit TctC
MLDLLSGQIDLSVTGTSLILGHVQSGKLRAIAVTATRRSGLLPNVPTMSEAGLRGYDVSGWYAPLAPAHTPANIVALLQQETVKALDQPKAKAFIAQEGGYAGGNTPERFGALIRTEIAKYTKLVNDAKIKSE